MGEPSSPDTTGPGQCPDGFGQAEGMKSAPRKRGHSMQVVCQACNNEIELPAPPNPRIINLESVSMIVMEHPQVYRCTECQARISYGLAGGESVALALIAIPLEDKPGHQVSPILAPSGLNIVKR